MRPLTVRTVHSSGPLFCRGLPVSGCCGGGESRLRGIEAGLHGGLVDPATEVSEEVADRLFAGVDDLAGGCLVDGVGDLPAEPLEVGTELFAEVIRRESGLQVHGGLPKARRGGGTPDRTDKRGWPCRHARELPDDLPRPPHSAAAIAGDITTASR